MSQPSATLTIEPPRSLPRRLVSFDPGAALLWACLAAACLVVLPPFYYLLKSSFLVGTLPARGVIGFGNYARVVALGGLDLWGVTALFAAGSSLTAISLGLPSAWLVARTNIPFRPAVFAGAFLSLAAPLIVKGIGWILLLGPNNGLINNWLRDEFAVAGTPIRLFGLGGMVFVEGLLWAPIAFLLLVPTLAAMDPMLEEAAAVCGARPWRTFWSVTLPLARPAIMAVTLLSFVRAMESFEVPLLIGIPAGILTVTTALYQSIHAGFIPRYGEATAYAVLLLLAVSLPLAGYYRATRQSSTFATLSGKGYRPARIDLGWWKYPCAAWAMLMPISLAAPLIVLLWASFLPFYADPSRHDFARMTMANYAALWMREDTVLGIYNSVVVGAGSACIVAAGSLTMSWIVARRREGLRWAVDAVASLPLVFPGLVLGIAILVEFLALRFIPLYGTVFIVMFAFVVKFLPYGMRLCHSGMLSINRDLEDMAFMCGAGHAAVLRRIVMPMAAPAAMAAMIYVFMQAARDLSIAVLLTGPNNAIVPVVMLDLWNNGELPQLAALSMIVVAGATLLGLVFMRLGAKHRFAL